MPVTRRLMHEEISYEEAKERETNILHLLGYFPKRLKFSRHLYKRRGLIEERVAHNLGLRSSALCHAAEPKHWLSGSFNVCIPVLVEGSAAPHVSLCGFLSLTVSGTSFDPAMDVDDIDPEMYNARREGFMRIFQAEEDRMFPSRQLRYSTVMNNGWRDGAFWYMLAVDSLNGLHELFYKRIQPKYSESHLHDAQFYRVAHQYWTPNIQTFIDGKVEDKKKYDEDLEKEFKED